jgi:glycosyltransferase involved in cell wall biosynthesis
MACRTPVVSTHLGAEGLDVEHEKHILLADTPKDFANAIIRLLSDKMLNERIRDEAFLLVRQRYDLSVAQQQVEKVLQKLAVIR